MPIVYMLCGKVGSGKTTLAQKIKAEENAFVLSCDDLMLNLFDECIGAAKHQDFLARCKRFLYEQAFSIIGMGHSVVLDFGFWTKAEREKTAAMFEEKGIKTKLIYVKKSDEEIKKQLAIRNEMQESGLVLAYNINEEKRLRFNAMFEEPSAENECLITMQ